MGHLIVLALYQDLGALLSDCPSAFSLDVFEHLKRRLGDPRRDTWYRGIWCFKVVSFISVLRGHSGTNIASTRKSRGEMIEITGKNVKYICFDRSRVLKLNEINNK